MSYASHTEAALERLGASSRIDRQIERVVRSTDVSVIRAAAAATLSHARLDALDTIAKRGMQGVTLVSQTEQQLGQLVPLAVSRLQALADVHALATAEEVASFTRRLP